MKKVLPLVLVASVFFILGGIFWPKNEAVEGTQSFSTPLIAPAGDFVKVTKVIDGDTIVLENGQTVRYIGIDAPETKGDCFAAESTNKNKELVLGKDVRLEKDVSETDRYKRLLRYVYVEGPSTDSGQTSLFVNDYLVRSGYAKVMTYPPDVKYNDKFLESEKYARENNLGLWSKCNNTTPIRSDVVSPTPSSQGTQMGNINCASNSYNCTNFKTQAEAQKVFESCGGTSNDIHKLDRDGDGRVCESLP